MPPRFIDALLRLAAGLMAGLLASVGAAGADPPIPAGGTQDIELSPVELLGEAEAGRLRDILPPGEAQRWTVYRPDTAASEPPGLLVYVSPAASGDLDARWRRALDTLNLAYVAAHRSGNRMPANRRMVLALLAPRVVARNYVFDTGRVYVAGYSGGGRIASRLAPRFPATFRGALYLCGVDPLPDTTALDLERLRDRRFVFLTGARDFNLEETRRVHRAYLKAGLLHSELIVVPGMGHENPGAPDFEAALRFLERD